jgi:hypothetical protein
MKQALLFIAGAVAGAIAWRLLSNPSNCCEMVAAGARSEVVDRFGENAAKVGDVLGVYGLAPGFINVTGYKI